MIETQELVLRIGNLTLMEETNLSIPRGAKVAIIGANGGGKTTLLRAIAGLHSPKKGVIKIAGRIANHGSKILIPPSERKMAMVFQELGLWPSLNVKNNILLGRPALEPSLWRDLLAPLSLEGLETKPPGILSGGQRQRVAIARALLHPVDWLLLDEPFSAIDQASRRGVADEIRKRAAHWNAGIICATHHPEDLELLGITRILQLDHGKLRESSSSVAS